MREAIRIAVFLVVVAAAGTAAADARPWSIKPPDGWEDMTELFRESPDGQRMVDAVTKAGGTIEIAAYMAGDDLGPLLVIYTKSPRDRGKGVPVLNFEAGVRNGLQKQLTEASYNHVEDGTAIVGDGVYTNGDQRIHVRLIAGVDRENNLHGVVGRCMGPDDVCGAAVKSLALDRTQLQPLVLTPASGGTVDEDSAAYRTGRIVGMLLVPVLVGAWFVSYLRRRRAATKPAGS